MQWLLNVHVHATFIEGRAYDAAARLNSRVLLQRKGKKKEKEKYKKERKSDYTVCRWYIELRMIQETLRNLCE